MNTHRIAPRLLERRVTVHLVGCGGNGSQMLTGLARLDRALRACGHPGGFHVTAWDPDHVTEANVGRQLFYPADIGANKAVVLVNRLNLCFGLDWEARPTVYAGAELKWSGQIGSHTAGALLITCVDTAKARREIHGRITDHHHGTHGTPVYWLDLGNRRTDGQVILGEPYDKLNGPRRGSAETLVREGTRRAYAKAEPLPHLPTVVEVFPELLDPELKEDNQPSCSLAEALESQDLFINDHVSRWALQLLWTLFRKGQIHYHGAFINLADGSVATLPVPGAVAAPAGEAREAVAA